MGFVVFPFADVILPLLLFDNSRQHADHQLVPQFGAQPSSIIVANNGNNNGITTATRLYPTGVATAGTPSSSSAAGNSQYTWNLPNGKVQFERPLSFAGIKIMPNGELESSDSSSSSSIISLWNPIFLGSGGSGAVFLFSTNPNYSQPDSKDTSSSSQTGKEMDNDQNNIAIKVSWKRSRESVENECNILQRLENVPHVEQCLGRPNPYPYEEGRVMIAVSPVISSSTSNNDGITSSVTNVNPGQPQRNAVKHAVETMIGMLNRGIYTLDVQPLISIETGDTLFIDFTEAKHCSYPLSSLDESGLVGFCSEMIALIPDSLSGVAREYLMAELDHGLSSGNDNETPLPEKVVDILESMWVD